MPSTHAYAISGFSLISFDLATPSTGTIISITGVTPTDVLVGIDFRPANGLLYGLGVDATGDTGTLYVISTETGQARVVGIAGALGLPDAANYGFDFNPAVDRIRVTTDLAALGLNFRLNPNTGALAGSDSAILGPTVSGVAYTNNQPQNGNITTLYTLDSTADVLNIQNPPNAGVQNLVGPTGVDFSAVGGFDIVAGVNAAASGSPVASGSGMALLNVGGTVGSLQYRSGDRCCDVRWQFPQRDHAGKRLCDPERSRRHSRHRAFGRRAESRLFQHCNARLQDERGSWRAYAGRNACRHRFPSGEWSTLCARGQCGCRYRHALSRRSIERRADSDWRAGRDYRWRPSRRRLRDGL